MRHSGPAFLAAALVSIGLLAGCASERAVRTADTRDQAFQLFEAGLAAETAGRYTEAVRFFTQALSAVRRPRARVATSDL